MTRFRLDLANTKTMPDINLIFPDGSQRQYAAGTTAREIATAISPSLAKRTVLARVDDHLLDVDRPITEALAAGGGHIALIDRNSPEALETLRRESTRES